MSGAEAGDRVPIEDVRGERTLQGLGELLVVPAEVKAMLHDDFADGIRREHAAIRAAHRLWNLRVCQVAVVDPQL